MHFNIISEKLFTHYCGLRRPVSKVKARALALQIFQELSPRLPLVWNALSEIQLSGELDAVITASLSFNEENYVNVIITDIYVNDDLEIVQYGSGWGCLSY